ncbi:MAG TPA: hypothetical protein PKE29_08560 [Phycisphaerales bacterium]|nr:hypothetical protein [Phycisphaerales bacterium]
MIVDLQHRPRIGPYILTRDLGPTVAFGAGGGGASMSFEERAARAGRVSLSARPQPDRFLALHEDHQTSHVAYRFAPLGGKAEEGRLIAAVESAALLEHPHALKIQQFTFDITGQAWVITPFSGDVDGLRSLTRLLREKGGQMSPVEAERVMHQLFEVIALAHGGGALQPPPGKQFDGVSAVSGATSGVARAVGCHGPISMDEVLVDRRGSLLVELYGLARALHNGQRPTMETLRDEIRSVVEIGYQLITGLRAEHPLIPAGRLVRRLDAKWDAWLNRGLDPSAGFDTAEAAMGSLPTNLRSGATRATNRSAKARQETTRGS